MRGLLLCCLVALATCESIRYDLGLNHQKTYEYKYEGVVNFGRGRPNLAESGVRLMCKVKIIGVSGSPQTFMLQVSDVAFEEFNGFPTKNAFEASPKLTKRLAAQLVKPFVFEYAHGHVDNIRAPADVSDTIVNIVRGILGFFQVTVKTTQRVYELEEISIHGICQSNYIVEEEDNMATKDNQTTKDMTITQVVDVSNCQKKAAIYRGMANAVVDKISSERGESIISTVRYIYKVKPTADGGLITKADALEQQHFTPFNVKGGTFKMQATKEIVLLGVTDTVGKPTVVGTALENRGNLVYKFVISDANIPIVMQNIPDPALKAVEMIKRLAEANIYQVDSASTEDTIKVYQLLRMVPFEGLEAMWKQLKGNDEHRRWFLDMIVEVNDDRILKFLELRFTAGDLTPIEAGQTVLVAFNHLQALPDLVEKAKHLVWGIPFSKSHPWHEWHEWHLWHTVVLSYGSLVNKLLANSAPCPSAAVQPLLDMAMAGLKTRSEEDMVLALKAIGNAGHPGSLKTIIHFLPGVAANPVELPLRVQVAAVQSMRLIAARDPHNVQDITLSLFVQSELLAEIRMMAFMIMFETKPPLALVSTVTAFLQEEKNHHVASFAYSLMRGFAQSSTPDNHFLSTACNVAVKILAHKFGRLSYRYSKAVHLDWFNDNFLVGTATEIFMLRSDTSTLPTAMMMKGKLHFLGRILQLLEFGIRADGIKELFDVLMAGFKGDLASFSDLQELLRLLQAWEQFPEDKLLLSVFVRAFGQEMLFADVKKKTIDNVIKAFNANYSAVKGSPLWDLIEDLQRGVSWHKTKALLILETRYIQATTLGFPLEISKYLETVNAITVKAKATINPPVKENLGQFMDSEILLETDGFYGSTLDLWGFHGINTELFQCGTELKSKLSLAVPWKFETKINIKEKKFELDFLPCKKDIEIISLSSNVFAVSRNSEDTAMAKRTPMMHDAIDTKVAQAAPAVVTSESETITSHPWNHHSKMCAESNIYGAGVCVESELKRDFNEEYPLCYLLGYTHVAFKLVPAHAIKPVDKIHIEANARPNNTHPVSTQSKQSTHQLLKTLRKLSEEAMRKISVSSSNHTSRVVSRQSQHDTREGMESTSEAVLDIKAMALSGKAKPDGYHTVVYYTPEAPVVQLIVSQVADESNWKMCTDATVDTCRAKVTAHMTWGAECQTYNLTMQAGMAAHLPGSKPTVQAAVDWDRIPDAMVAMGKRIERYIPGMAYLLGFYQQDGANARQEVSARFVASSADSIDMKIKLPEYTLERKEMPMPLAGANFQDDQQYPTTTTSPDPRLRNDPNHGPEAHTGPETKSC